MRRGTPITGQKRLPRGAGFLAALLPPLVALGLILGVWEVYSDAVLGAVPGGDRLLPAPSKILAAFVTNAGVLAPHTWQTVLETALGFALALAVGLGLALLIDVSALLRRAIYPLLVMSQTVPVVAIAPLMVLWFGFGILPKVLIVALVCFFPIVVSGVDGLRSADPELVKLFRTFGAGTWAIFRRVRFPGALPAIFSGVRIAVTYSVVGAVWGEYVGARYGLGVFMQLQQNNTQIAQEFAALIVIAAISIALFLLVSIVERLVIPWHFAARSAPGVAETEVTPVEKTDRRLAL